MVKQNSTEIIEAIASEIGENVYMDIAKWHLYLSDARLHTVVAEQVYPMLASNSLDENSVLQILQSIPVKIGGGKREIPLADLLPMQCQVNMMDILEKYQSEM
jgi:hypothetical protein